MAASKYAGWAAREVGDVERTVRTYLADHARDGPIYVKSTRVSSDLDISTHRAGQAIAKLAEESTVLEIEAWSGEAADVTTWHVTLEGPTPYGRECCGSIVPEDADQCPRCGQEVGR